MSTTTIAGGPPAVEAAERVYFPELDGLRLVAFLSVYLFHGGVPDFPGWINAAVGVLPSAVRGHLPANTGFTIQNNGWVGVQLFFVLSGYLIATLLLREERRFGRISLRAFWARRVLRIWPLYYLTVALTFFAMPLAEGVTASGYWPAFGRQLPWFLLFLGNWSMGLIGPVGNDAISVLWSVCVEEQFYIVGPLLVAWVVPRYRIAVVVFLMTVGVIGRYLLTPSASHPLLFQYASITHLDTLLSGVLLALVLARFPPGVRAARAMRLGQWPLYAGLLFLLTRPNLGHGGPWREVGDFVAIWLAGVGLVAVATVGRGILARVLAYPRFVWLGKISYGLYMYHEIALWLGRRAGDFLGWFPNKESLLPIGTAAATVSLAALSYYGFERPFLRWKRAWTRVPSRPV